MHRFSYFSSMLQIGTAKADITAFKEGVGMMGYGMFWNIMRHIETRMYSRAVAFDNGIKKVVFVTCEIGFVTPSLKQGVLKLLNEEHADLTLHDNDILITATHTHSGPSGYSHHGLYNTSAPGFVQEIYDTMVEGIAKSIVDAFAKLQPAKMFLGKDEFAPELEVGFNRSLDAYLANPEAKKVTWETRNLAINREMKLLKFVAEDGKNIGSANWFAVHPTSMPNTNTSVCSDNKGYGALYMEEETDVVSVFAQGNCGDVTPRFIKNKKLPMIRGYWEGKYPDDIKSAQYNGRLQADKALEIINTKATKDVTSNETDSVITYLNFGNLEADPKFTNGETGFTSPSCMGIKFLEGTEIDGPGMIRPLALLISFFVTLVKFWEQITARYKSKEWREEVERKYEAQGVKHIVLETNEKRIAGTPNLKNIIMPGWLDPVWFRLKKWHREGAMTEREWTPRILPLQILKVGKVALASFPFEITTIAGERLQKTLDEVLLGNGFEEVILCPYSNAYSGYIVTREEYEVHKYEAGHCVFGKWSLACLQTEFEKLANEMLKKPKDRIVNNKGPEPFSQDVLDKFAHFESSVAKRLKRKWKKEEAKLNS